MAIRLDQDRGLVQPNDEQLALECPYCGVYAHMSPQSVPDVTQLLATRPKHVGIVCQCDSCRAPVFLRFGIREYRESSVELLQNFMELERPRERFPFSYLPDETEALFREALSCYSNNNFNAFASMCRRAAHSSFKALGDTGKLRAYDEIMIAQDIAGIDDDSFEPIKQVLFESGPDIPSIERSQAGVLLEVLKDMFYQCFVRRGKLTRAIKVRRFFVEDGGAGLQSSA